MPESKIPRSGVPRPTLHTRNRSVRLDRVEEKRNTDQTKATTGNKTKGTYKSVYQRYLDGQL